MAFLFQQLCSNGVINNRQNQLVNSQRSIQTQAPARMLTRAVACFTGIVIVSFHKLTNFTWL